MEGKLEQSLDIFWSKKRWKEVAREEAEMKLGRTASAPRERREFSEDHSILGLSE